VIRVLRDCPVHLVKTVPQGQLDYLDQLGYRDYLANKALLGYRVQLALTVPQALLV
jgi:hypothetical protein